MRRKVIAQGYELRGGSRAAYFDAINWRILQCHTPEDFVVGTGERHTLQEFVALTCAKMGLGWREWVVSDPTLRRPNDIPVTSGNATRAREVPDCEARVRLRQLIQRLLSNDAGAVT